MGPCVARRHTAAMYPARGTRHYPTVTRHWLTVAAVLVMMVSPLLADSYRCGRKVVRNGDTAAAVRKACGDPLRQRSGHERIRMEGRSQRVRVERWLYQNSPRSLPRELVFYRGEVVAIHMADR